MWAWWSYWLSLAIAVILWVGAVLLAPDRDIRAVLANPALAAFLVAPLAAAGLNLVVFRRSHEEVCRVEAERHRWLRAVVGEGYSASTFAITGVVLLALVAWIVATIIL